MTRTLDLIHIHGDTFSQRISLSNAFASQFNEVWFTVRSSLPAEDIIDDTGVLSSGTLTGGEIVQTGQTEWTVIIENPDWPVGRLNYDVQVRSTAGQIFTITHGTLRVYNDVTRSR